MASAAAPCEQPMPLERVTFFCQMRLSTSFEQQMFMAGADDENI